MKHLFKLTLGAGLLVIPLLSGADSLNPIYVQDSSGTVFRNTPGECWHSEWKTDKSTVDCGGKVEPPPPSAALTPESPVERHESMTMSDALDGKALFEFNKDRLTPAAEARLDRFVNRIKQRFGEVQRVMVTGYTDRLGSDSYNLDLSRRRAKTVRSYLLRHGVGNQDNIETEGRGKADPVTSCNNRSRRALIKCLAGDRRVVIDVTGTEAAKQ